MLAVQEATEFGPEGLKVFAVCPGFVVSNLRGSSDEARRGGVRETRRCRGRRF